MKFIKTTFILLMILASVSTSYSLDLITVSDYEKVAVIFNGQRLSEGASGKIINGELMLPMRTYFEILGASIKWVDSTREVVAYKDNNFIKVKIDSDLAYRNGKEFKLSKKPIIVDKSTYVPSKLIADMFGLKHSYNKSEKTLTLDHVQSSVKFNFIKDSYFKRIPFDDFGVYVSIPQLWEKSKESKNRYEYYEGDIYYSVDISSSKLKLNENIESFVSELKNFEFKKYSTNINYTGSYEDTINGIDTKVISNIIKNNYKQIRFLLKEGNTLYTLDFKYSLNAPEIDTVDIINSIAKSFQISNFTVNYNDEHYIEYDSMYKNGLKIDQEIYSNKEIKGVMKFSGSVNPNSSITGLKVSVSRLGSTKNFTIPLKDNKFDSNLYTPFGLGKHNVSVEAIWKDENKLLKKDPKLLEFSLINLEIDKLIYLIPSEKVQKDDIEISSLGNLLTYDKLRKFDKAKSIFEWISKNINIKQGSSFDNPKDSISVFNDEYGNSLEVNLLYTALLRSIDIPSRVVLARNIGGSSYYYTELYINGEWLASDLLTSIRIVNSENNPKLELSSYFISDVDDFKRNFDSVEILNY